MTTMERPNPERERTYWNGEETPCRKVWLTVADAPAFPLFWARNYNGVNLIGTRVPAVEVRYTYHDADSEDVGIFYLFDEDDRGWRKVTIGKGSPHYGHSNLDPEPGSVQPRL